MHGSAQIANEIQRLLQAVTMREERARKIAQAIRAARGYRWAGLYEVTPAEIGIIGSTGTERPAFPRFPVTQGLCGACVSSGAPVIVNDVTKDQRYLTTFGNTRSEMIVPIRHHGTGAIVGLIDVESERLNAFSDDDRAFLESCAAILSGLF